MSFHPIRAINSKSYNRINVVSGQVIDTIEIIGEMACKSQMITGMCEKKCMGNVWIDQRGKKYCPHAEGIVFVKQ